MTEDEMLTEYRKLPPDLQAKFRDYVRELTERRRQQLR